VSIVDGKLAYYLNFLMLTPVFLSLLRFSVFSRFNFEAPFRHRALPRFDEQERSMSTAMTATSLRLFMTPYSSLYMKPSPFSLIFMACGLAWTGWADRGAILCQPIRCEEARVAGKHDFGHQSPSYKGIRRALDP